jgi:hypothetical protein
MCRWHQNWISIIHSHDRVIKDIQVNQDLRFTNWNGLQNLLRVLSVPSLAKAALNPHLLHGLQISTGQGRRNEGREGHSVRTTRPIGREHQAKQALCFMPVALVVKRCVQKNWVYAAAVSSSVWRRSCAGTHTSLDIHKQQTSILSHSFTK